MTKSNQLCHVPVHPLYSRGRGTLQSQAKARYFTDLPSTFPSRRHHYETLHTSRNTSGYGGRAVRLLLLPLSTSSRAANLPRGCCSCALPFASSPVMGVWFFRGQSQLAHHEYEQTGGRNLLSAPTLSGKSCGVLHHTIQPEYVGCSGFDLAANSFFNHINAPLW